MKVTVQTGEGVGAILDFSLAYSLRVVAMIQRELRECSYSVTAHQVGTSSALYISNEVPFVASW